MIVQDDEDAAEPAEDGSDPKAKKPRVAKAKPKVKAKAKCKRAAKGTSSQGSTRGDNTAYSRAYRQIQQFPAACLFKLRVFLFWSHRLKIALNQLCSAVCIR